MNTVRLIREALTTAPWVVLRRLWRTIAAAHRPEYIDELTPRCLRCRRCMVPAPCQPYKDAAKHIAEATARIERGASL